MRTMFTPLKIAGMEVKKQNFMAPMSLGYESQDGTVNEENGSLLAQACARRCGMYHRRRYKC